MRTLNAVQVFGVFFVFFAPRGDGLIDLGRGAGGAAGGFGSEVLVLDVVAEPAFFGGGALAGVSLGFQVFHGLLQGLAVHVHVHRFAARLDGFVVEAQLLEQVSDLGPVAQPRLGHGDLQGHGADPVGDLGEVQVWLGGLGRDDAAEEVDRVVLIGEVVSPDFFGQQHLVDDRGAQRLLVFGSGLFAVGGLAPLSHCEQLFVADHVVGVEAQAADVHLDGEVEAVFFDRALGVVEELAGLALVAGEAADAGCRIARVVAAAGRVVFLLLSEKGQGKVL